MAHRRARPGTRGQVAGALTSGLAVLAAACAPAPAARSWTSERDSIGDTVVVRTISGSVWGDGARLVADLSIGELDGPEEYLFGSVTALAVSSTGVIYAFDSHVRALRAYAPDGTFLRRLGREGAGPGEFRSPDAGLAVLPDDRVLLRDPGNARINVYAPDGTPLTSWRLPGGLSTSRPLFTDTAGNTYTRFLLDADVPAVAREYGLRAYARDGRVGDPLTVPTWDYDPPTLVATRDFGDGRTGQRTWTVPFAPGASWTWSPLGYFVGGVATAYAIDLFGR